MAVFDDLSVDRKLVLLPHAVEWVDRMPVGRMREVAPQIPDAARVPVRGPAGAPAQPLPGRPSGETTGHGLTTGAALVHPQVSGRPLALDDGVQPSPSLASGSISLSEPRR